MASPTPTTRSILFLDDEEKILEILAEIFLQWGMGAWQVHTANNTAKALNLLQENRIDLAVIDLNMPVVDGLQFMQLLNRKHPNLVKVALTGDATESKRAEAAKCGAELFLEKPRSAEGWESLYATLNELVSWHQEPQEGFRGVLRQVGLTDVIQMECLSRSSCILELTSPAGKGRIFIKNGSINHAEMGALQGQNAFNALLSLKGGDFNLRAYAEPSTETVSGQWEFLLMEAARLKDELTLAADSPAGAAAPVEEPAMTLPEFDLFRAIAPAAPPVPDPSSGDPLAGAVASPSPEPAEPSPAESALAPDASPTLAPAAAPPPITLVEPPKTTSRVDEIVICSGQGDVLYEWQCQALELRLKLMEFVSGRAQQLSATFPLGSFDRLEIIGPQGRIVTQLQPDKRLLVRTTTLLSS